MNIDNLKKIRALQNKEIKKYKSKVALESLLTPSKPYILDSDTKKDSKIDISRNINDEYSPSIDSRDDSSVSDNSSYDSKISSDTSDIDEQSDEQSQQPIHSNVIQKQFSSKSFKQINGKVVEDIISNVQVSGTNDDSLQGDYMIKDSVHDIDIHDHIYSTRQLSELLSNPVILPNNTFNKAIFKLNKSNQYPRIENMIHDLIQARNQFTSGGTKKKGGMFHSLMMNEKINIIIDPVKYSRKIVVEPKTIQKSGGRLIRDIDSISHFSNKDKTKLLDICTSLSKSEQYKLIQEIKEDNKSMEHILTGLNIDK